MNFSGKWCCKLKEKWIIKCKYTKHFPIYFSYKKIYYNNVTAVSPFYDVSCIFLPKVAKRALVPKKTVYHYANHFGIVSWACYRKFAYVEITHFNVNFSYIREFQNVSHIISQHYIPASLHYYALQFPVNYALLT
jgi:hypothetical protein